jgi:hypothetical protein
MVFRTPVISISQHDQEHTTIYDQKLSPTMNPAALPYQQPYQPVVINTTRPRYALHKARLGLRIAATVVVVLAFILDIVGGATYNTYTFYDGEQDDYPWPIAGTSMVSYPPFVHSRPDRLTIARYPSP